MPGVYIAAWYNNNSPYPTVLMSSKPIEASTTAHISDPRKESKSNEVRTPILIFISAHAIGSLGFALSLLSIWFGWLLPTTVPPPASEPEPKIAEIKKSRSPNRQPRRPTRSLSSRPPALPVPIRRSSAPVDLASILVPHSDEMQQHGKRVCFADASPITPIARRNTMPEPSSSQSSYHIPSLLQLVETFDSSMSEPSTPQSTKEEPLAEAFTAALNDLATQSDSSRPPSQTSFIKPASRFQKLKLGFNVKSPKLPPPQSEQHGDQMSVASIDTNVSDKAAKRASGSFVPPWSMTRPRTAPEMNTDSQPSTPSPARLAFLHRSSTPTNQTNPSPTSSTTSLCAHAPKIDILSPNFLSRKAQRRTSTPVPRTKPYEAPYFAEPPILLDNKTRKRTSHPKSSYRPATDENSAPSAPASDTEGRGRTRRNSIRRVALNPQTPQPLVQQRSASEHISQRQSICV